MVDSMEPLMVDPSAVHSVEKMADQKEFEKADSSAGYSVDH